jgi:poly(3-hydroxyoctanoate) depolymerase
VRQPVRSKPEIQRMRISGHELRVGVWPGESTNVPLLIFNGIGSRLELLCSFVQMLDPDRKVIVFDVPGTGESPAPRLPYRLWMLVRLTSQLLDQLGHERVHIMGVSWGGAIAQQFAVQRSTRCEQLILAATATGMLMIPGDLRTLVKMATPRRITDRGYLEKHFGGLYGGSARADPALFEEVGRQMHSANWMGYLFQQLALIGWSSLPFLPLVRQQTLILAGDDDPLVPLANAKLMAFLIPRSQVRVLQDGHLFLFSRGAESAAAVNSFLSDERSKQREVQQTDRAVDAINRERPG